MMTDILGNVLCKAISFKRTGKMSLTQYSTSKMSLTQYSTLPSFMGILHLASQSSLNKRT